MKVCRPGKLKIAIAAAYSLMVLFTSVIPMDRSIKGLNWVISITPTIQNLLHIPAFAVLTILWLQVMKDFDISEWKRTVIVLFSTLSFGILTEIIQSVIPGRYPGIGDIVFNTLGVLGGILLFTSIERMRPGFLRRLICG